MSWHYSRALVVAYWGGVSSAGQPSAPSSGKPTPQAYLSPDRMTAFSRLSRFGMTCEPLTDALGADVLTWCLAVSPARTSAQPEKVLESKASAAACGTTWRGSLARYDRTTSSWKTPQCSLLEGLDEFSETWPRWGMMRRGECSGQSMPAHLTSATESGSSELLPTPLASIGTNGGPNQRDSSGRPGLQMAAMTWPTPSANKQTASGELTNADGSPWDGMSKPHSAKTGKPVQTALLDAVRVWPTPTVCGNNNRKGLSAKSGDGLATAVKIWPTPAARDSKGANSREHCEVNGTGRKHMDQLANAVAYQDLRWPTPCARDHFPPHKPEYIAAKREQGHGMSNLNDAVAHPSMFATPQARDFRSGSTDRWDNPERTRNLNYQIGGQLNPTWVEWLMGWPLGWTDLKPLETDKFRQWLNLHGKPSTND